MAFISKADQNRIDQEVDKILLQTNLSYPRDGLLDITSALGIEVKTIDFQEFGDKVSGVIQRDPPVIFLNDRHTKERQTFTLAHEIGHFVLHKGTKLRIDKYNYKVDTVEAKEETEANYFAATLLMPRTELISILEKISDLDQVAKYFGVSAPAVINRIRWLRRN